MIRVLITGGRTYTDKASVYKFLDLIHRDFKIDMIVTGGAKGADQLAHQWAVDNRIHTWTFPPNWKLYGPSAGPIRNYYMLKESNPDIIAAFPGGKGTENMVSQAIAQGRTIYYLRRDGLIIRPGD